MISICKTIMILFLKELYVYKNIQAFFFHIYKTYMNNTIEDYKGIEDSASPLSCNASSWHPYVVIGFTLLNTVISLGKQFLNNNKHMSLTTI